MDGDQDDFSSISDDYLNESFASVGNSTRSLLSPILNEKLYIKTSTPGKDRQESQRGTEDEVEDRFEDEDEENSYIPEKSKNMVLTSISLSKRSGEKSQSRSKSRSGSSYSSSFNSSYLESSKHKDPERGNHLSPWEKWLITKTSENREKLRTKKMEELKSKIELEEKEKVKETKQKDIEEKISEWKEMKDQMEKIRREEKRREKEEQRRAKMQKQMEIEEKSRKVYKSWLKEKKASDLEEKRKKENEEREEKEKKVDRHMKSEEAFEEWLKKSKKGSGSNDQSYGQVGLQGCYDWASYPTPAYINPMPWVQPAPKHHRAKPRRKKELQPVSPPLLFRDYEKRTKKKSSKPFK